MRSVVSRTQPRRPALAPGLLPDLERIERARTLASRLPQAHLREVTLVRAPFGFGPPSSRTWLALESMQITDSFKVRGALLAMEALVAAAKGAPVEVLAVSAGNHGIGVSYAAKVLGAKATIVVPRGAPKAKTDKIAAYGATIITAQSTGYDDAEAEAIELARTRSLPFLSPYDDLDVLTGNGASLGFEIARALGKSPDLVFCPNGGGGLATGLALSIDDDDRTHVFRVWGVQSEASCAFARSLESGAAVTTLPPAETLAEGLEGGISERGFARARALLAGAVVVTEDEIAHAMKVAYRDLGLVLEGSAAVALAPVLATQTARSEPDEIDVVVVLTGRNVDPDRLARIVC
jgi:threonine dehydratase